MVPPHHLLFVPLQPSTNESFSLVSIPSLKPFSKHSQSQIVLGVVGVVVLFGECSLLFILNVSVEKRQLCRRRALMDDFCFFLFFFKPAPLWCSAGPVERCGGPQPPVWGPTEEIMLSSVSDIFKCLFFARVSCEKCTVFFFVFPAV